MRLMTWTCACMAICTAGAFPALLSAQTATQTAAAQQNGPRTVLVELFTSEGCSSCPPADDILRRIDGRTLDTGQLIVGLSEHVTYWNHDGWKDPFSAQIFTDRQNNYGGRFHLADVYTPQMVVDGESQINGSDGRALLAAIKAANSPSAVSLHIDSATVAGGRLSIAFSVAGELPHHGADVFAVVADDQDTSNVLAGENKGRTITYVSVARNIARVATLKAAGNETVAVALPARENGSARHLILFVQQSGQGRVLAIASQPLRN